MKRSVLGINWKKKECEARMVKAICQKYGISQVLARALAVRKVLFDEVESFLDPKIKTSLPDPFGLSGVEEAVNHVVEAISNNKKITIFADYDVDGATSAAILKRFFRNIGVEVAIYVPDRILEGYGPNSKALLDLKKSGTDLVITVDCGTVSFKPLLDAKEAGLEVIVIDHHLGVIERPEAIAIINPNLIDENFEHKEICGAGVTFLFVVALNKRLREKGAYGGVKNCELVIKRSVREPNLMELLDLVALGTVCDVMPLTGINRVFVAQGLKVLRKRQNLGLRQICDLSGLEQELTSYHFGFVIGPRINAGGRVGESDLGARILSSEDEFEVEEISHHLEEFNKQRKDIEIQVLEQAVEMLESQDSKFRASDSILFVASKGWHQGVIGIVASRLKDMYNKPVAVIAIDDDGKKGKASCRSIPGIDFGAQILAARSMDLLLEGGGHAMAGGFSVEIDKIKELHQFFCDNLGKKVEELFGNKIKEYELELDLPQVNIELLKELEKLEPFGVGNVKPKFILRDLRVVNARLVGKEQNHVSCVFSSASNVGFAGQIQGIFFGSKIVSEVSPVAEYLLDTRKKGSVSIVGVLNINSWMGVNKPQIIIEDLLL